MTGHRAGVAAGHRRPGGQYLWLTAAVPALVQVAVIGDHHDRPVRRVGSGGNGGGQPPHPLVRGPHGGMVVRASANQVTRDVHRAEVDE